METTFEFCIFISGKEKKQLQKCNTTILLSMHDKPGTSNVCDYRVLLIWFSSIRGEDLNVKVHDKRRTDDDGRQVMTKA
jgi:hypothetical protein